MIDQWNSNGWSHTELENIFQFVLGGDWGKDPTVDQDNDYSSALCIRGSEIKNWNVDKGNTAAIRLLKQSSIDKRQLIENDILLEISGGGPDQPVGRVVIIDKEVLDYEPTLPKVCTNFLRLIRLSPLVNSRFIYHYLDYFYHTGEVTKYQGGSNNLRNLKFKDYAKISIPLPPLPEQMRVVSKLDSLFHHLNTLKDQLEQVPKLLSDFRQQVLTQAVNGKLTEEWRGGGPLWRTERALECCEKVQSGGTPKKDGFSDSGIPFLKVYNIVNNEVNFDYRPQFVTDEAHNGKIKKSILYPGDVLMNIVGPPLNKIAIVPNNYEEWNLNQAITLFRPKEYLSNKFLYFFFCEGRSVRSVHNQTRGVVGQVNISLTQCRNFEIPIPSLEEQVEIVNRVEKLFAIADHIEANYQLLKEKTDKLPQAILNKAFKGELVPQDPNDEPASALLKRIKKEKK